MQLSPKAIRKASPAEGGPVPALDGLTCGIHERHVGSIIGPSGLGKTTFLRRDLITEALAGN